MDKGSLDQQSISLVYFTIATTIILHRYYLSKSQGSLSCKSSLDIENNDMWRNVGVKSDEDQDIEIDDEEELVESEEEITRQRDVLYGIIVPTSSPHGVTCLMKTLDASILFLKMSRLIDKRLQNNSKIDEFFDYLNTIEQDNARISRNGFGNLKVIVIEGLLSSGKSTLIDGLKTVTGASTITGVPALLLEIKYLFNSADVPEAVLTALDCVINYCIAHQIISETAAHPTGAIL